MSRQQRRMHEVYPHELQERRSFDVLPGRAPCMHEERLGFSGYDALTSVVNRRLSLSGLVVPPLAAVVRSEIQQHIARSGILGHRGCGCGGGGRGTSGATSLTTPERVVEGIIAFSACYAACRLTGHSKDECWAACVEYLSTSPPDNGGGVPA